jgi:hypothetical protein
MKEGRKTHTLFWMRERHERMAGSLSAPIARVRRVRTAAPGLLLKQCLKLPAGMAWKFKCKFKWKLKSYSSTTHLASTDLCDDQELQVATYKDISVSSSILQRIIPFQTS